MKLYHACVVQIEDRGILIDGTSGSGKTSTALRLLEHAKLTGRTAHLIGDDQVFLEPQNSDLTASVPEAIAGKIEIRGFGISDHAYIEKSHIHLIARIVEDEKIDRMPDDHSIEIEGISLPLLYLPRKHEELAMRIIFAWLDANR